MTEARVEDPNWQQIVCEIIGSGMTQSAIAARLGLTQGAVSNLVTGRTKKVDWTVGQTLLGIRAEIVATEPTK